VRIEEVSPENKKLILGLVGVAGAGGERGGSMNLVGMPQTRWFQGIVQSVATFGLFVRPAGYDSIGLVHQSRIPRDLTAALKKRVPPAANGNTSDVQHLFREGDVVKARVQSSDGKKIELSMLPFRANEEDEDDYVVEGRDPEGDEDKFQQDQRDEDENEERYDAEDTLLWWRGAPYVKSSAGTEAVMDEEVEVVKESTDIIEGTWRRMFEVDMREDAADFSSKVRDAEMKELEEEIGELMGLDDDMSSGIGFGSTTSLSSKKVGQFVSLSSLPAEWKAEMEFFKELEKAEGDRKIGLKAGKASEQSEFESLLREVEVEIDASNARAPRRDDAPVVEEAQAPPAQAAPAEAAAQ